MIYRYIYLFILCCPLTAQAFYQYQQGDTFFEARGLVHALGLAANNPNDPLLFTDDKIAGGAISGRLILDAAWQHWQLEMHALQSYQQNTLTTGGQRYRVLRDVERSDALDWHFAANEASLVFDRLNVQYGKDNLNIKLGRQPINLASSFYFTPNDFFAPFAAQVFYRTYKPGVDAARIDWQWDDLSQLTLLAVLNYQADANQASGWSNDPDWSNTAYLARLSSLIGQTQWGLLFAEIDHDTIIGFDFQSELFGWLGVRGEGHSRFYNEANSDSDKQLSLSFEYRPNSRTSFRLEQFYQQRGAHSVASYSLSNSVQPFYLARHYTAVGASYELSPLLNTDVLLMRNDVDKSNLLAFYANYSLSNESEFALGLNLPFGKQPCNGRLQSEFGTYPQSVSIELRSYF